MVRTPQVSLPQNDVDLECHGRLATEGRRDIAGGAGFCDLHEAKEIAEGGRSHQLWCCLRCAGKASVAKVKAEKAFLRHCRSTPRRLDLPLRMGQTFRLAPGQQLELNGILSRESHTLASFNSLLF